MEQRKWLSWNDVERLAARLEDVQLERSRRTTYLPSELYKLKAPNWLGTKPPTEPTQHTETPVGTKSYRGVWYRHRNTVAAGWLACEATPPEWRLTSLGGKPCRLATSRSAELRRRRGDS